jgi:hypothetical protein
MLINGSETPTLKGSVADPHHIDADPEPDYHFDDSDPTFYCNADPDPDPSFQINSKP